eukprot:SAG11_NODE_1152_length_5663_cov_110.803379_5_plen_91_part_00
MQPYLLILCPYHDMCVDMVAIINRDDVDFDNADDLPPVQQWTLPADSPADGIDYPTNYAKFQNVQTLCAATHPLCYAPPAPKLPTQTLRG